MGGWAEKLPARNIPIVESADADTTGVGRFEPSGWGR
jgi:hypothetical protein